MTFSKPFIFLLFILTGVSTFVQAAESHFRYSSQNPPFSAEVLSSVTALGKVPEILMGVQFKLSSGWKMYAPDQKKTGAGLMPGLQITWKGSQNVKDLTVTWPPSSHHTLGEFDFQAWQGEFIIPFVLKVLNPSQPVTLRLQLTYSLCSNLCIPFHHALTLTLPPGTATLTPAAELLSQGTKGAQKQEETSYVMMLVFAFLGGVILNFMPCVLPVISLKIMGIAKKSRAAPSKINHFRPSFLATFFGIMVSFALLGGGAALLDSLGHSVGWGVHFQQPSFLCFLILVMTLFANNLWGFYEIELPFFIQDKMSRLLGYEHDHHAGLVEDFVAGVLAAFLATPCTAPFLGTALGYAFSRSGSEIFLFFMALGLGFSLPYWLGALLPRHWLKLPKPGAWMLTLSRTLGYVLAATVCWLVWILSETSSLSIAFYAGCAALLMTFVFWRSPQHSKIRRWNWLIALFMLCTPLMSTVDPYINIPTQENWKPFQPQIIPDLVRKGKIVVVDVTASWCLLCKFNKTFVLDSKEAEALLTQKDVILMRADWTRRAPSIGQYLASYGRAGIPFNAVFGPLAKEGNILPEILSLESLKTALSQARGKRK